MSFLDACTNGDIEMVRQLYNEDDAFTGIDLSIDNYHFEIAELLTTLMIRSYHDRQNRNNNFLEACDKGDIGIAKQLVNKQDISLGLVKASAQGHIELVKILSWIKVQMEPVLYIYRFIYWVKKRYCGSILKSYHRCYDILERIQTRYILYYMPLEESHGSYRVFLAAYINNNLEIVKFLRASGVDIHAFGDRAFRDVCYLGHLDMAKWMHSEGANIHSNNNEAFKDSCVKGYIELAKWLYELGANIHTVSIKPLSGSYPLCPKINMNDPKIMTKDSHKWINRKYTFSVFTETCVSGQFEVAKWLHEIGVNSKDNYAFCMSSFLYFDRRFANDVYKSYLEIFQWLNDLHPNLLIENLFHVNSLMLRLLGFSDVCIDIIESIRKHNHLPEFNDIDDEIVYALAHYGNIELLNEISIKLPFIGYELDGDNVQCSITRVQMKSARTIIY